MNRMLRDEPATRPAHRSPFTLPRTVAPAQWARGLAPWCLAACLLPLTACEPRFGEGNTVPPTPPTQPKPDSSRVPPAPAVPGQ